MDSTVPSPTPRPNEPRDFADLARRISGRTTDLFAIALVVVLMLTVGVQVTHWWRADPPAVGGESSTSAPLAVFDQAAGLAVTIDGGTWTLERKTVVGTADAITTNAILDLRQSVASSSDIELPAVDPAESEWLGKLQSWPPAVETGNGGRIYTLGGPWPWIVATIAATSESDSDAPANARVICWVFALPQSGQSWTLYTARRRGHLISTTPDANIPLPDEAQRLLTATTTGGGLATFRAADSIVKVRSEWDQQLVSAGWARFGDWSQMEAVFRATFESRDHTTTLDAILTQTDDGETRGIAEWRNEKLSPSTQ